MSAPYRDVPAPEFQNDPELFRLQNDADDAALEYEYLKVQIGRAADRKLMTEYRRDRYQRRHEREKDSEQ